MSNVKKPSVPVRLFTHEMTLIYSPEVIPKHLDPQRYSYKTKEKFMYFKSQLSPLIITQLLRVWTTEMMTNLLDLDPIQDCFIIS